MKKLTDEQKQELCRLAWKAGRTAKTCEERETIDRQLQLAVSEGWDAESDDDIDYMWANIL
jgi:hypothetical protein